ncbi:MAG: Crp/Fnr family transcriptional regulator [Sphingomicrobium sp.]
MNIDVHEARDIAAAFAGNRLLATFSDEARDLVLPHGTLVELKPSNVVLKRGNQVESTIFPIGETMISMGVELAGGRSIEVASIGREGAVGGIISCGHAPVFARAVALTGGPAIRVPMRALEEAKRRSGFIANIFCRFSDFLLSQIMQSVACNAFHSIPERAARWLLHAQDRAGDRIELTQEAFADLLGVQRTTVNTVIRSLIDEGLITTGRGVMQVVDRDGLKRRSCECYSKLEDHFAEVIGTTGFGPGN